MKVEGKAALVTGGAQGLGKAFTKILLQHGAKVLLMDIGEEQGETTLSEFQKDYGQDNVIFFKGDVTSESDMQDCFQLARSTFGRLDIVVNNAGIADNSTDPKWELCIQINMTAAIRGIRLALNYLRKDQGGEGGLIINISSLAALFPQPSAPLYAATKAGLLMYSQSVAADPEVTENGVRVNAICPSFVDTQLIKVLKAMGPVNPEVQKILKEEGIMSVDYVAECLYELVTDDSKNGAVLTVGETRGKSYVSPYTQ